MQKSKIQSFRTNIQIVEAKQKIDLQTPILSIGSCFSELIGQKLQNHKFSVLLNPFGTLFNPIVIFDLLKISITQKIPSVFDDLYLQNQSLWKHYWLHSKFADFSKTTLKDRITNIFGKLRNFFENPNEKIILMTLGTAWIYRLKSEKIIVANCHKVPSNFFDKDLLSIEEIENSFNELLSFLEVQNTKIILTVSPVRHIKEGLANNQISKSILRLFCENMTRKHECIDYFPSYEMMLDDLRDYRFYASDMIHPSETAENYIWQKFQETYFNKETQKFIQDWQKIRRQLTHKPLHITAEYLDFLNNTVLKLQNFAHQVNIEEEKYILEKEIEVVKNYL